MLTQLETDVCHAIINLSEHLKPRKYETVAVKVTANNAVNYINKYVSEDYEYVDSLTHENSIILIFRKEVADK